MLVYLHNDYLRETAGLTSYESIVLKFAEDDYPWYYFLNQKSPKNRLRYIFLICQKKTEGGIKFLMTYLV